MKQMMEILRCFDKIVLDNKKINMKDTIIVAGAPRSGTTWLMELLATMPRYTYLFEPLNPIWFPESYERGFQSRTYLSEKIVWPDGEGYLKKVFTGMVFSSEPAYKPKIEMIMHRLFGNKLIVKSVNWNRLLPWISQRFQLRHMFLMIRHPCAVIDSQLRTGFFGYHPIVPPYTDVFPTLNNILDEVQSIDWLDERVLNILKKIKTKEGILAAVWCLDYYIPLSFSKPHPWVPVIYERLVKYGEKEIARIFNEIGGKNVPKLAYRQLKKASLSTMKDDKKMVAKENEQPYKWEKNLSKEQIDRIFKIVSDFGLDFYPEDLDAKYNDIIVKR